MLPALPAAAALIGLSFGELGTGQIAHRASRAVRLLLPVPILLGSLTAAILYGGATLAAAVAYLAGLGVAIWCVWRLTAARRLSSSLILLAVLLPVTVVSVWPAYQVLGRPSTADLAVQEIRADGLSPSEVAIVDHWRLIERIGLMEGPIDGYQYVPSVDAQALAGKALIIATRAEDAEALRTLGYRVTELRGALGGGDVSDLFSAIARRDLDGLKAEHGDLLYVARPGG